MTYAAVRYLIRGVTNDILEENDSLTLSIEDPSPDRCQFCLSVLDRRYNSDVPYNWHTSDFVVTRQLTANWKEVMVAIRAENSFVNPTRWDVDDVQLHICSIE